MRANVLDLQRARFWVRPYEFEGDGSTGAADDVAALEVGGQTRTFWLKTLEGRLFFREVGRDEAWNFGALEIARSDDLAAELARVLASENYGRVVLLQNIRRPEYLLAAPNERFQTCITHAQVTLTGRWKPQKSARIRHFLDWPLGVFGSINYNNVQPVSLEFVEALLQAPIAVVAARWTRGSQQEWERVINAVLVCGLAHFCEESDQWSAIWDLQSAWAHGEMYFSCRYEIHSLLQVMPDFSPFSRFVQQRARFLKNDFCFVGQDKDSGGNCRPLTLQGTVTAPTHHEILEAHVFLRDWINQRLPPTKARRWLDFF